MNTHPIVIVGSGLAGYTVAREFRRLDQNSPIVLLTADSGDFYSKPMLSNALAQGKTAAQLVTSPAADMSAQLGLDLRVRTRVRAIRATDHVIASDTGDIPYGKLVLAVGSDAISLAIAGDGAESVLSVNDLGDYGRLRAELEPAARIVILGGGLIGCEFANDLAVAGHQVAIVDPAHYPLSSLIPEVAGRRLLGALLRLDVTAHFGLFATAVHRATDGLRVALNDGTSVHADIVLSAVGARPRLGLARDAGLAVNRGIVTNNYLRTSDADIYAIGDCAEVDGQVRPYVLPIMHSARALAATLSGVPTPATFPPMPVMVKTPACPLAALPAPRDAIGGWNTQADVVGLKMVFEDGDGRALGFVLTEGRMGERLALARMLDLRVNVATPV